MGESQAQAVGQGGKGQDAAGCALRVGADGVRRDVARLVGVGQSEQAGGLRVGRAAEEFGGRAVLEDAPFVHEGDMVCQRGGFFGRMGHEDGGDVLTADALVGQAVEVVAQVGVEAGKGFVQEQQGWFDNQGAGEGEALLFAAGEAAGFAAGFVFQTDVAQRLHGLCFDFGFGQAAHFESETDVFLGGQVREQGVVLEHQRDVALFGRDGGDVLPVQPDFAAVGFDDACDDFEQGGFAAAGASEYGEGFACGHGQADAVSDGFAVEAFADVGKSEHGFQTTFWRIGEGKRRGLTGLLIVL